MYLKLSVLQGYFSETFWLGWKRDASLMKGVGFIPQRTFSHLKTSVRDQRFRHRERHAGHQDQFVSEDQEFAKLLMDLQIDLPRILMKLNLGGTDQINQLSKR